jgi:ABC-type multidrug transport system ATPase subunit
MIEMYISTPFVIETQELSKTYKNVQALRSLDLKVQQNSIFGFLGPNGAGKTTTIKLLLGLIRSRCRNMEVIHYEKET